MATFWCIMWLVTVAVSLFIWKASNTQFDQLYEVVMKYHSLLGKANDKCRDVSRDLEVTQSQLAREKEVTALIVNERAKAEERFRRIADIACDTEGESASDYEPS